MSATVRVDLRGIEAVDRALARLQNAQIPDLLDKVGGLVEMQTQRRLRDEQTAPDGTPWPYWSERYAATRHNNQGLLQNEGNLLQSIQYLVTDGAVKVGSNLEYAAAHNFGHPEKGVPQRQFVGISTANYDELNREIDAWVEGLLWS